MSMRTRPRCRAAAAIGAAAVIFLTGCGAFSAESELETVLVGVDLEKTGSGDAFGVIYEQALELRVEQVNQQGLLGDRRLELDIRDNRSDPGAAAQNVADFAADPRVAAIITGGCGPCLQASLPAAEESQVPLISLASADPDVPADERRHIFKVGPNAADNAGALVTELSRADVSTVGLAATTDAYGETAVQEFIDAAERAGIDVVVTVSVDPQEEPDALGGPAGEIADWSDPGDQQIDPTTGLPIQGGNDSETGPDAVALWLPAPQSGQFAETLRDSGYDGRLYLDAIGADELFLSGSVGDALEGSTLIFTETLVMDTVLATSPAKAARKAWFNTYSARYGTYHAHSSFAADAIQLIVEAINRTDDTDRGGLRDAVERIQLDGISGPLRITPDNHSGLTSVALVPLVASGDRWQSAR